MRHINYKQVKTLIIGSLASIALSPLVSNVEAATKVSAHPVQHGVSHAQSQHKQVLNKKNISTAQHTVKHQVSSNLWNLIGSQISIGHNVNNPRVKKEISRLAKHPEAVYKLLSNATPYLYYVYQQVKKHGMPIRFALLPLIESNYNPLAHSGPGAVGLWQMMPGTASSHGLEIGWWRDGRRDVVASTQSALNYLEEMHHSLGKWPLVAAGYNAGPGAVRAAIDTNKRLHRSTDFWSLPLPRQTRNYVPKLLALAAIIKNPKKYGIKLPYVANRPYFASVTLTSQLDLTEIAKLAGVSKHTVRELNPGMSRFATQPKTKVKILLPVQNVKPFLANLEKLKGRAHVGWQYHEVRKGQTLASIAHNYHTQLALLKKVNHLKNGHVRPREGILVPLNSQIRYTNARVNHASLSKVYASVRKSTIRQVTVADILKSSERSSAHMEVASANSNNKGPVKKNNSLRSLLNKIYGSS